jgi:hypothetical protein
MVAHKDPKGPLQCNLCQRLGNAQLNCIYAPRSVAFWDANPSGSSVNPKQQNMCCSCRGINTANYRACIKWKEANVAAAKPAQGEGGRKVCEPIACQRLNCPPKTSPEQHEVDTV